MKRANARDRKLLPATVMGERDWALPRLIDRYGRLSRFGRLRPDSISEPSRRPAGGSPSGQQSQSLGKD